MDISKDPKITLANNLSFLLELYHIERKQLCKDLEVKYTTFCDWINGKTYPRIDSLSKLANYFNIDSSWLLIEISTNDEISRRIKEYVRTMRKLHKESYEESIYAKKTIAECFAEGDTRHRSLEERMEEYGGELPLHEEFNWGPPIGREIW